MTNIVPLRLVSREDASVNFVFPNGQEARYVRRETDYFIVYLSSHGGCNKACRFCHLTQTKQTEMDAATLEDFILQAKTVLEHYKAQVDAGEEPPAERIHFNWMARGEPMENKTVILQWPSIADALYAMAEGLGIREVRFNISTILPSSVLAYEDPFESFSDAAKHLQPTIFYSAYSPSDDFKRRWIPMALSTEAGLSHLGYAQRRYGLNVVLHWALIEGENDGLLDALTIGRMVKKEKLKARFNLVRYNPYGPGQGQEPKERHMRDYLEILEHYMEVSGSRVVPRVGFDVKASCGMFVQS